MNGGRDGGHGARGDDAPRGRTGGLNGSAD